MTKSNATNSENDFNYLGLSESNIILILKIIIIVLLAILNFGYFYGQSPAKIKPSCGSEIFSTGNGHGTFYSIYLAANKGRNALSIGPVLQQRSMRANGFKIGYSRILTVDSANAEEKSEKDLFQLNFFTSMQYTNKLPLSKATLYEEKLIWGDNKPGLENIRLTTAEIVVGFALYVNITNRISWKNYFGASVYYHINYNEILNHQKIAPSLCLGSGICFYLQKTNSNPRLNTYL